MHCDVFGYPFTAISSRTVHGTLSDSLVTTVTDFWQRENAHISKEIQITNTVHGNLSHGRQMITHFLR
jgi:hypothetical protein